MERNSIIPDTFLRVLNSFLTICPNCSIPFRHLFFLGYSLSSFRWKTKIFHFALSQLIFLIFFLYMFIILVIYYDYLIIYTIFIVMISHLHFFMKYNRFTLYGLLGNLLPTNCFYVFSFFQV